MIHILLSEVDIETQEYNLKAYILHIVFQGLDAKAIVYLELQTVYGKLCSHTTSKFHT